MLLLLVALESSYRDERNGLSAVDDDIIKRIGEDDNEAFRILYEATAKPLFGFALSILKDRYDAEDALHDTYIKLKSCAHLYQVGLPALEKQQVFVRPGFIERIVYIPFPGHAVKGLGIPG